MNDRQFTNPISDDPVERLLWAVKFYKFLENNHSLSTWAEELVDDAKKFETIGGYIHRKIGDELNDRLRNTVIACKYKPRVGVCAFDDL
jgi:hypothetical protein